MRWRRHWLIVIVLIVSAAPGSAGIIFNRKPKANPAERVPQLVYQLKTDKDDDKRAQAAEELRNFDAAAYPEIVNALVEAALGDPKPKVRVEALQSLGKIRPISQRAGWALEQAAASDTNLRVQMQARSSLVTYRMSGYRSANGEPPPEGRTLKTEEPPLAEPVVTPSPAVKSTSAKKKIFQRQPAPAAPTPVTSAPAAPVPGPAPTPTPPVIEGPELTIPK